MNNIQSPKSNPSDKNISNNRIYSKYSPHSDSANVYNGCHCQDMFEGGSDITREFSDGQLKDENDTTTKQSRKEDDTILNDKNFNNKQNVFNDYNLQIMSQL